MRKNMGWILILLILGTGVYAFNLNNGLFWDDDDWIINNVSVHSISWDNIKFWFTNNTLAGVGLKSNYYRPFLFFTFAANYMIAGVKPLLWHLTSNLIHLANGVLVFVLIKKILLTTSNLRTSHVLRFDVKRFSQLTAFLTATIFTIHPLNTEAVTYISGRGDPLVALFMLLGLLFFIKDFRRPAISYKLSAIGFLILALLSRETAIIFPFLLMVFYIAFIAQDPEGVALRPYGAGKFIKSIKKSFISALPYFGVVVVYGILRLTVLNFQNTLNFYPVANIYSESLYARLLTFGGVLVDYVRLLFVPVGLHMERSSVVYTSLFQWPIWGVFLGLIGLVAWLAYLYRKERARGQQTPNSDFRIWLFGAGWFFIGLAPVSGITPINAVMYEHWLYLPMVGFWVIASFYLVKLFVFLNHKSQTTPKESLWLHTGQANNKQFINSNDQNSKKFGIWKLVLVIFVAFYLSFFGYQSIKRNILWGQPVEFFQDILKYEPKSVRVNNNLGNLFFNRGDIVKAEEYYRNATEAGDVFAQPYYNIGSILQSRGDIFGAIKEYEKAIEVDPTFHYSYQNLMVVYANQGDLVKAAEYGETLKQLRSNDPRVYYNLALIYLAGNDKEAAIENLRQGLSVTKNDIEAEQLIKELLNRISD